MPVSQEDYETRKNAFRQTVSMRLKSLLKTKGKSVATVCNNMGMSQNILNKILSGKNTRQLTLYEFYRICVFVNEPPENIIPLFDAMTAWERKNKNTYARISLIDRKEISLMNSYRELPPAEKDALLLIAESLAAKSLTSHNS